MRIYRFLLDYEANEYIYVTDQSDGRILFSGDHFYVIFCDECEEEE